MNFEQISDAFYGGLIGSFATWLFVVLGQRLYNSIRLYKVKGTYKGYSMELSPHPVDKIYSARFSFIKNKLLLGLKSNKKGMWEAEIPISTWTPITGMGNYTYLEDGKFSDDWGIMQVWLNIKKNTIMIEASPRSQEGMGTAKYIIEKEK